MQIRPARDGDALGIAQVHVSSWQSNYRGIVPDDFLQNLTIEPRQRMWQRAIDTGRSVLQVAEMDERIVGFVSGGTPQAPFKDYDAELYTIYILADHQGQGIGRKLFTVCVQELATRGHQSMFLWVLADNPDACGFYAHLGGDVVGEGSFDLPSASLKTVAYGWSNLLSQ